MTSCIILDVVDLCLILWTSKFEASVFNILFTENLYIQVLRIVCVWTELYEASSSALLCTLLNFFRSYENKAYIDDKWDAWFFAKYRATSFFCFYNIVAFNGHAYFHAIKYVLVNEPLPTRAHEIIFPRLPNTLDVMCCDALPRLYNSWSWLITSRHPWDFPPF